MGRGGCPRDCYAAVSAAAASRRCGRCVRCCPATPGIKRRRMMPRSANLLDRALDDVEGRVVATVSGAPSGLLCYSSCLIHTSCSSLQWNSNLDSNFGSLRQAFGCVQHCSTKVPTGALQ